MQLDTIVQADALTYLQSLPDESVHLIVTSPPYFGLRDYGTGTWSGGDPACDHAVGRFTTPASSKQTSNSGSGTMQARSVCPKCGARRIDTQIGQEPTPAAFVAALVDVFREARRVLRNDGNCYVNLGDSYNGSGKGRNADGTHQPGGKQGTNTGTVVGLLGKTTFDGLPPKSLMGIPWRFAIAMQDDGWLLREDIIWAKGNPMPESVRDRCTRSHEYIFHFTKGPRYWYDKEAVAEDSSPDMQRRAALGHTRGANGKVDAGRNDASSLRGADAMAITATGRNRRSVWSINPASFKGAHFATFPEAIPEICIKAACPEGGVVLDPFMGAGTVGLVAKRLNRRYLGCDLNAEYVAMAQGRIESISYTLMSLLGGSQTELQGDGKWSDHD